MCTQFTTSAGARERIVRPITFFTEQYEHVVDNWHRAGAGVHAGYIMGLPFDERGCGRRAAKNLADIGVDIVSFFAYTPCHAQWTPSDDGRYLADPRRRGAT